MAIVIDLTINNPSLSALAGKRYEQKSTPVPNGKLPQSLQAQLGEIFNALTGQEMSAEDNTILATSKGGAFHRLYSPKAYASKESESGFVIRWGKTNIELDASSKTLVPVGLPQNDNLEMKFVDIPVGKSRDLVLRISLFNETTAEATLLDIPCGVEDWQNPPLADDINSLVKRAPKKANNEFSKPTEYTEFSGETYGMNELKVGEYRVSSYRGVKAGTRDTFILQCLPNAELGFNEVFQVWSDNSINPALFMNPTISEEQPAILKVHDLQTKKDGKIRAVVGLILPQAPQANEGDLDLDF